MLVQLLAAVSLVVSAGATEFLDKNLAYRSPFKGWDEVCQIQSGSWDLRVDHLLNKFSLNTRAIEARHIAFAKRQVIGSTGFEDEHYPTFYGGDFSNVSAFLSLYLASLSHPWLIRVRSCGMAA